MKEMNSLTHSCMHSLASLAIFAFSGSAPFMILATGAKLRMLASQSSLPLLLLLEERDLSGGVVEEVDGGDEDIIDYRKSRWNRIDAG